MTLQTRVERAGLSVAMGLPPRVVRTLAGRPVRADGNTLAADLQLMLRLQRLARIPNAEELPLTDGREVVRDHTVLTAGRQPIGSVRSMEVAGLPARLYTPAGETATGPLLVFFHGGGFWSGGLDTHDAACRFQAETARIRVLAIDYRLGPEHPFPAAHDDAEAAYAWAVDHVAELGDDPARLAVGGDSAGGNLAAGVAIEAARRGWPCALQLLVYPVTQSGRRTRSAELFAEGFYLTRAYMQRADKHLADGVPDDDPRLSPLHAELPPGLAPALLYTAGFDPLRDEGEAYAEKLRAAGVAVTAHRFPDQIHGFFNIVGVGRTSVAANRRIAGDLRSALS